MSLILTKRFVVINVLKCYVQLYCHPPSMDEYEYNMLGYNFFYCFMYNILFVILDTVLIYAMLICMTLVINRFMLILNTKNLLKNNFNSIIRMCGQT